MEVSSSSSNNNEGQMNLNEIFSDVEDYYKRLFLTDVYHFREDSRDIGQDYIKQQVFCCDDVSRTKLIQISELIKRHEKYRDLEYTFIYEVIIFAFYSLNLVEHHDFLTTSMLNNGEKGPKKLELLIDLTFNELEVEVDSETLDPATEFRRFAFGFDTVNNTGGKRRNLRNLHKKTKRHHQKKRKLNTRRRK